MLGNRSNIGIPLLCVKARVAYRDPSGITTFKRPTGEMVLTEHLREKDEVLED